MRRRLRIKTYMMLTMSLVIFLSLAVLTALFVYAYKSSLYGDVRQDADRRSTDIVDIMSDTGVEGIDTDENLKFKVDEAAEVQDGRLLIINRKYKVVKDTEKNSQNAFIINKNVMDVMMGNVKEIRYDTESDTVIMLPIVKGGNIDGTLIYRASLIESNTKIDKAADHAFLLLLFVLLVDIFLTGIVSKRVVTDIHDINEKIMHAALGNLQERLPEKEGFVEIQVLAENYNEVLERLATIDQTRSEFVSNVSHELKTPITSMKVLAESLTQNETASAEDYKEFMGDIVDEIDRETKIINDLLTLVKTDNNSTEMNLEEADINEMMETIVKTVGPLAKQRGIDLSYESYREVIARVDQVKLSLAISNLIENAVKYNVDNGWIKCSLNADNRYFYIKVADSGVGIPEDAKDRVFDRFYRVDKARSRDTGGTGLGLSITRGIVNAHKGTIKLYSESGKGTTFTVKIPLDIK